MAGDKNKKPIDFYKDFIESARAFLPNMDAVLNDLSEREALFDEDLTVQELHDLSDLFDFMSEYTTQAVNERESSSEDQPGGLPGGPS